MDIETVKAIAHGVAIGRSRVFAQIKTINRSTEREIVGTTYTQRGAFYDRDDAVLTDQPGGLHPAAIEAAEIVYAEALANEIRNTEHRLTVLQFFAHAPMGRTLDIGAQRSADRERLEHELDAALEKPHA